MSRFLAEFKSLFQRGGKRDVPMIRGFVLFVFVMLLLVVFILNMISFNFTAAYSNSEIKKGLKAVKTRDVSNVKKVQQKINYLIEHEESLSVKPRSSVYYIKKFRNSVILGDSITEGLTVYGFLTEEEVFCSIGASLAGSQKIFRKASKTYPKHAFFSFGMNDLITYRGKVKPFIKEYKKKLRFFLKRSKETEIYINSISKPDKSAIKRIRSLKNYKKYNKALKEMCEEEGWTYIDNSYILEKHKNYYAGDGIHVSPAYYPYWLNDMITEAEL